MAGLRELTVVAGVTLGLTAGTTAALASPLVTTESATVASSHAAQGASAPAPSSSRSSSSTTAAAPAGRAAQARAGAKHAAPPCSARLGGGDWPSYGNDASNSRTQAAEHTLTPSLPGGLTPAWTFKLSSVGDPGQFESTPVLVGGCAFVASTSAVVYAVDATSGVPVWHHALAAPVPGLGGGIVGALAVTGGRVIVLVNQTGDGSSTGPYVAALDQHTGAPLWQSAPITTSSGYYSNASPQVFNGIVFVGYSPPEGDPTGQGGFVLLNATNGALLKATTTISAADQKQGFAGGGIWSTPAFDPATQYAYVGAGNPFSKPVEDPHTNAILKVDLDPGRATFGQIVAAYKGNVDQYTQALQQLAQTPACSVSTALPDPLDNPVCGQLDLDFGAAPNLFRSNGRLVVGDLQKSGVYHVASAADMSPVWATVVGASCQVCNAGSTAASGGSVFGEGTPGGLAFGLSQATGTLGWATPVGDGVHYQSTSVANGVVYSFDTAGFLDAFDAVTGAPLMRRPMSADAQAPAVSFTSGGIAIAYHTVFVAASQGGPSSGTAQDGFLIAYRG
jgi:polyvinyl alcohol dehydrogenase (cytochrome)